MTKYFKTFGFIFGIFFIINLSAQSLQTKLAGKFTYVVAKDGSGNFQKVQEAINASPENSTNRTVIFIKNGLYEEKITIKSTKQNLTLVGENIDSTILSWGDWAQKTEYWYKYSPADSIFLSNNTTKEVGTQYTYSFGVGASNFTATNLTIRNSAGNVGQAVAVRIFNSSTDKVTFLHCKLLGNQDTYYTQNYGRIYNKDCFIEGNVDFIFGRGIAFFDSCQISSNRSDCQITAASSEASYKYGYVFKNCKISRPSSSITGVSLGRPWRANANVVFVNSNLGPHITTTGWSEWSGNTNHTTCYYAEYKNNGPGWMPYSRVSFGKILTSSDASKYSIESVFDKSANPSPYADNWLPNFENDSIYKIIKDNTTKFLVASPIVTDSTEWVATLKSLKYNSLDVSDFNAYKLSYDITITGIKTSVLAITALSTINGAKVEIIKPDTLPGNIKITVYAKDTESKKEYTIKCNLITNINYASAWLSHTISNPFNDQLMIKIYHSTSPNTRISIYNMSGTIVKTIDLEKHSIQANQYAINTSDLKPGAYLYSINAGKFSAKGKILKIK